MLRQIRSIRRSVSRHFLMSLVVSLDISRLDYGSATAGLPNSLLDRLQSAMNAAARLVCSARKYDHVTPLLRDVHWLRVPERIQFRLAVLAFRCLHGLAPSYHATEIRRVADVNSRQRLRSASSAALLIPLTHHSTIGDRAFPVACCSIMEQFTTVTHHADITTSLQAAAEGRALQTIFRRRMMFLDSNNRRSLCNLFRFIMCIGRLIVALRVFGLTPR